MERKHVNADVGVIVGRFQVDRLHEGHRELLDWVCKEHTKVIVVLGTARVPGTRNNPLDWEARSQMIRESYPNVIIACVKDVRSDEIWSKDLDEVVGTYVNPSQSVVLYGCRESFIKYYAGRYNTQELVGDAPHWSGTSARDRIKQTVLPNANFRAGVVWGAYNSYPRNLATVDVAVLKNARKCLLLARKPAESLFRFIGGFSDPRSVSYEADARREVVEEASIEITDPVYIGSATVDDWRYRNEVDKIKTLFFVADYMFGKPEAKDDIAELREFSVEAPGDRDKIMELIVPEHRPLWALLRKKLWENA